MALSAETLSVAMLATLVLALLVGFPVSFTLAAVGAAFGAAGIAGGYFDLAFLSAIAFRILGVFQSDNFLAIPFLILMGMLLERTGIAEDMLLALEQIFGATPGALAYTTVIVGAVLSALTGFVSASVIALGLIALPVMLRAGYDAAFASGVVAASGTLAQVIPPSLVLIVLAEQLDVSLLSIYRGALLPSMLLILLYIGYVFLVSRFKPALIPKAREPALRAPLRSRMPLLLSAALPLTLLALVLGSIYFGIATPGEGGAVGVTGTLALAIAKRRLTRQRLRGALERSAVLCSGLLFLLFGASFFTLVFRGLNGHLWIESFFQQGAGGALGFVVFVNVAVFLLAFVLDFFEIAFIVLPLLGPIAHKLGVDMVWLAVLLAFNLQTSFMHPPFGIALYNLRSVAPESVRTMQIYWGAVPFIFLQVLMIVVLILVPGIVLKPKVEAIDPSTITIELPALEIPENEK